MMIIPLLFPLLLPLLCRPSLFARAALPRRSWSSLDLAALEEEWEAGDDPDALTTPDDELLHLLERERDAALERAESLRESGSEREWERAAVDAEKAGKAAMIFATLREDAGAGWDWDSMAKICNLWSTWLDHALVEVNCFPIEPAGRGGEASILLTAARGWNGDDVYRFLTEHPHPKTVASEVKWDGRTAKLLRRSS